jgi:hypothetical protein
MVTNAQVLAYVGIGTGGTDGVVYGHCVRGLWVCCKSGQGRRGGCAAV